jgi:hypothetical protein
MFVRKCPKIVKTKKEYWDQVLSTFRSVVVRTRSKPVSHCTHDNLAYAGKSQSQARWKVLRSLSTCSARKYTRMPLSTVMGTCNDNGTRTIGGGVGVWED